METPKTQQERPQHLKRKLTSALAMLLVATILMTTTSYAWFVLSTAPEVTGISTNVGANGSLEIALLNTDTRTDMSTIRAGIGDSLAANNLAANNAWGNLVDLGFIDYGLGNLMLMPARLNVAANANGEGYTVDPGMLAVPTYGYDGRIIELTDNTVSAIYQEGDFAFSAGIQDYGVRAIGTSDALTVQGSSLALAKSNIASYSKSAKSNTVAVLNESGETLFNIVVTHAQDSGATYSDTDRDALREMLVDLEQSTGYLDAALRQGLVAFAASEIGSEETFNAVKDRILDTSVELTQIMDNLSEVATVPGAFSTWVTALDEMQNDLNAGKNACDALTGGTYTWQEIRTVLDCVMKIEELYIEGTKYENLNASALMGLIGKELTMTLAPGSGVYADMAEFVGNYSTVMTAYGTDIQITTACAMDPVYMDALSDSIKDLTAAGGEGEDAPALPLTATYGYALDLAFRCNTDGADLLLQTAPIQRVYNQEGEESVSGSTQGGGSYMEFTSKDDLLTLDQKDALMDAIRVGFLDDQNNLLAVAKLNMSNRSSENGVVRADLYLYDYLFEVDEIGGGLYLTMGERKAADNVIVSKEIMKKNEPKAVTVVVWLDGDLVDNTMVSATEAASLNGVLNLQFATSAELVPAKDGALLNYTADKTGLEELLQMHETTFTAGQGTYTTVSWNAFYTAYDRALSVYETDNAGETQIRNAMLNLVRAAAALEVVSQEPVTNKIAQLREQMGTVTDETARLVIKNEDGGYSAVGNEEHTQEEHDSWEIVGEISRVDYNKNLTDEGNGIYTPIYSEESWNAMAGALYEAEAVVQNENATDEQLNAALSAIEAAEKALERQVFFKPYEYKGTIYYEAICDADNADTYGKWYDSSFKRIVSDLTILNLDAYATPAVITEIGQDVYVASDAEYINPDITFLEQIYPELREESVKGVKWDELDAEMFTEVMNDRHLATLNNLISVVNDEGLSVDTSAAQKLVNDYSGTSKPTAAEAAAQIQSLNDAVVTALEEKAENDASASTNMTANQRLLLTTAVSNAKAVAGYDDASKTDLDGLRTATADAEALLASEAAVSQTQAAEALSALNAALKAANAAEVTEYNTLTHKLPDGTGASDIVYDVEYPGITVKLNGKSGTSTIGAQILTQNGIVVTVTKDITVYDRADGLLLRKVGETDRVTGLTLSAGGTVDLTAELLYEAGGVNTGDKALDTLVRESIKSFSWASGNTAAATVVGKDAGICTVTAAGSGAALISVSVETHQGNYYTYEIPVTVQ